MHLLLLHLRSLGCSTAKLLDKGEILHLLEQRVR